MSLIMLIPTSYFSETRSALLLTHGTVGNMDNIQDHWHLCVLQYTSTASNRGLQRRHQWTRCAAGPVLNHFNRLDTIDWTLCTLQRTWVGRLFSSLTLQTTMFKGAVTYHQVWCGVAFWKSAPYDVMRGRKWACPPRCVLSTSLPSGTVANVGLSVWSVPPFGWCRHSTANLFHMGTLLYRILSTPALAFKPIIPSNLFRVVLYHFK